MDIMEGLEFAGDFADVLLEEEGECVASIDWDSGGMAGGSTSLVLFRGHYVMLDSWAGIFNAVQADDTLDAMDYFDMFNVGGADTWIGADADTDELIARLRVIEGDGTRIIMVNAAEVEVDFDAGTIRRLK